MTTTPTSGAADLPEALRSIQRFEVVDCIDDKHVPAVIPKPHGPWVRYEDHIAALAAGQATAAQTVAERVVPQMTAQEVNDLPTKAREYIHQLAANADPAGMVRENKQLRDTNKGLQKMYRRAFADGIEVAAKLADAHAGRPCAGEVLASAIRYAIDQDAAPETPEPKTTPAQPAVQQGAAYAALPYQWREKVAELADQLEKCGVAWIRTNGGTTYNVGRNDGAKFAASELRKVLADETEHVALRASHGQAPATQQAGATKAHVRLVRVIADKIEDGTLFRSGIYSNKDLARFVRNVADAAAPQFPTAQAAESGPAIQGETNVQLDTDSNHSAPGQQRDMACSLALGQPVGNGSDQVAGHPGAQGDKLLTVAERNIRSFLRSATFKSESDREAALNCVDVLWEAARAPADSVTAPAGPSRFADVIAVQRSEAEADTSDAYMVGLYNGMSMMDANYRNITDWEPMGTVPKPTPAAQAAPALAENGHLTQAGHDLLMEATLAGATLVSKGRLVGDMAQAAESAPAVDYPPLPARRRAFLCTKCGGRECEPGTIGESQPPCKCGHLGFAEDLDFTEDQMRDFADRTHALRMQAAPKAAPGVGDELRDTLVAVSAAIAEQDDRAAQKMIREILAASPTPPAEQQAASSAVLKAIREANMQLVRTGDDAFMLVPYKVATADAAESVPVVLGDDELVRLGKSPESGLHPWGIGTTRADYLRALRAVLAASRASADSVPAQVLVAALIATKQAINSMKAEAETAAQGDEQMMLEACETISNEGLQADIAIRAALASAQQPAPSAAVLDYPHARRFGGCPACGRSDCVAMSCTRTTSDDLLHIAARKQGGA